MGVVLSKEAVEKSEFLENTEKELREGLHHQALASARERLRLIPGDVDARIVIGRAFIGLGELEEAVAILEGVEADILRWESILQRSKASVPSKMFAEIARSEKEMLKDSDASLVDQPDGHNFLKRTPSSGPPQSGLLPEFKTATMAELYIKQGHFDMAREVLNSILERDPADAGARLKLRKLDLIQTARCSLSDERRLLVLNELESWLTKIGSRRRKFK